MTVKEETNNSNKFFKKVLSKSKNHNNCLSGLQNVHLCPWLNADNVICKLSTKWFGDKNRKGEKTKLKIGKYLNIKSNVKSSGIKARKG